MPPPSRHKTRNFLRHFVRFGRSFKEPDRGMSTLIFGFITSDFERFMSNSCSATAGFGVAISKIGSASLADNSEKRSVSGGNRGESETTIEPTSFIKSSKSSVPCVCLQDKLIKA